MTTSEIKRILAEHYTPEELCELLDICSMELVNEFSYCVEERMEDILERISEELGYGDDGDTED